MVRDDRSFPSYPTFSPMVTRPALPVLIAVCLALVAAPFPGIDGFGGLPPAGASTATPGGSPAPRSAPPPDDRRVSVASGPRLGPLAPVVGPVLGVVASSSATAAAAVPAVPVAPPVTAPSPPVPPPPAVPLPVAPPPVPGPAPAPPVAPNVTVDPAGGDWLRRRAEDTLAYVAYPWRRLGYGVVFGAARPGLRARTLLAERRIEVYPRRGDTARRTAFDLAHEVAHAFDFSRATWAARDRWHAARGLDPAAPWFGCNACADLATPAGDFAESFADWQVPGGDFRSTMGPPPDDGQRALLIELTTL